MNEIGNKVTARVVAPDPRVGTFEFLRRTRPLVGGAPTLILCYHRVAAGVHDPYRLCVSPEHFESHLAVLGRRANPATLDEVMEPSRDPRYVITFDDGYRDNLDNAFPIAFGAGAPITVYVTSGAINSTKGFWWDRLGYILARARGKTVSRATLGDEPITLGGAKEIAAARTSLHSMLRRRHPLEISVWLDEFAADLDVDGAVGPEALPLTTEQLRLLASADHRVTVGAHTVNHELLRGSGYDEQLETMSQSRTSLEATLGRDVRHFAYPYGDASAIDADSVLASRHAGFLTATTTLPGLLGRSSSLLALRRRLVMDWTPRRFTLQLARWGFR